MSNWVPITITDLQNARVAKLIEALATKALAAGQADPTPQITATTVEEIRMAIAFSGRYVLDTDASRIPASLLALGVQRVCRQMKSRLMDLTDQEREDERTYQARLKDINAGKWPIERPDTAAPSSPAQASSAFQVVSPSRPRVTSDSLKGF